MTNQNTEARHPRQRTALEVPMASSLVLSFATLAGGVFIEVPAGATERSDRDRCFRFDDEGRSEYAFFGDLVENGDMARWYGHQFSANDFVFA